MQVGQVRLRCALGHSGLSAIKREGDGATPLGVMSVLSGFYKRPLSMFQHTAVPLRRLRRNDGWCDDVGDANYNRLVRLPYPAGAEIMHRDDGLYDIGFVLDWNISSRRQGRGSAIFLHLARKNLAPTQGCIALTRRDMLRLAPYLGRQTKITICR